MNLAESLRDQLESADFGRPAKIWASEGKVRVEVTLGDCDRLGCLLNRLDVEWVECDNMALDPARIESRITYLGEKLVAIEREAKKGKTILRSAPPRTDGEKTTFFEMELNPSKGLSLLRYSFDSKTGERLTVPAPLTRETLDRIIEDLIDMVAHTENTGPAQGRF